MQRLDNLEISLAALWILFTIVALLLIPLMLVTIQHLTQRIELLHRAMMDLHHPQQLQT